jgi:hypothetical protein
VEQVLEVRDLGRQRRDALGEEALDRGLVPGLLEALVEEVVDQLVHAHALVLPLVPGEVGERDLLARGQDVDPVAAPHQAAGELRGVGLGPARGVRRVAVADEQDLHVRDSEGEHTLPGRMTETMRKLKITLWVLLGLFLLLQLVPAGRTNPPVTGEIVAPPQVKAALVRCCYDCHSNQTRWPWYAYVNPVAFFVVHDTDAGRKKLNFSIWESYAAGRRQTKANDVLSEIQEGEMPLRAYLWMHPDARPSAAELQAISDWTDSALGGNEQPR